jgi:hypothetical protein
VAEQALTKAERDATPLTLDEFEQVGRALFGERWQTPLFTAIGWTVGHGFKVTKTHTEERDGKRVEVRRPLPLHVRDRETDEWVLLRTLLRALLVERAAVLQSARRMLDGAI